MRVKQTSSQFPVYIVPIAIGIGSLILGLLCSLTGVASYDQGPEWTQFVLMGLGCFAVPGMGLASAGFVSWYARVLKSKQQSEIEHMENATMDELEVIQRDRWLDGLDDPSWDTSTCEVEMESKFIFQLLKYLGYDERNMAMRVRIPVQEGRLDTTIEADWVLVNADDVVAIVEAKAPRESLSDRVVEQAKSYAIRLNAPVYVITNGLEIAVYHREVVGERAVFHARIEELAGRWDELQGVAGKSTVFELHSQLKNNLV